MIEFDQFVGGLIPDVVRSLVVTCALSVLLWCALRLPAIRRQLISPVRHALWWLVCVRFLLGLFPIPVVSVTVPKAAERLSSPIVHSALARPIRRYFAQPARSAATAIPAAIVVAPGAALGDADPGDPAAAKVVANRVPHQGMSRLAVSAWPAFWVWPAGCLLMLAATIRGIVRAMRVVRTSQRCVDVTKVELLENVCRVMGCRPPRLFVRSGSDGPMVVGIFRPAIVVSQSCLEGLDEPRLRAVFAHEVAHVRRGDLWLSLVPALCRIVLWFLPPAWIAARECAASAEEACDAWARRVAQIGIAEYGETLIRLARSDSQWVGAANVSPAYRSLLPRLAALKHERVGDATHMQAAARLCAVVALLAMLPAYQFSLRARASSPDESDASAPAYTLIDLGASLPDGSAATAVNDPGAVVGYSAGEGSFDLTRAEEWQAGAALPLLSAAGYRSAKAFAVNSRGDVALATYNYRDWEHAALADGGEVETLGTLAGYRFGAATAVNERRIVAGFLYRRERGGQLQARPVEWSSGPGGFRPQDLGTLGGPYGEAYGINAGGTIVGKADISSSITHGFAWQPGRMVDLGTLPGARDSAAYSDNAGGEIVGYSQTAGGPEHAVLWTSPTAQPIDLGALFVGGVSKARAVNDQGDIVGVSTHVGGTDAHATLWIRDCAYDLNQLAHTPSGWTLRYAVAVNNSGQIVGVGQVNGKTHAFLLTPAPPSPNAGGAGEEAAHRG